MAAILDSSDASSPSAYTSSQTALLLLDFQRFTVVQCPQGGSAVLKASQIRNWALSKDILILHNIIDFHGGIPTTTKNCNRLRTYLDTLATDETNMELPSSLSPGDSKREHITLKQPGVVSGLAMPDVQALLEKNKIKSLILCGLATSGAVMRLATAATDSGFVVTVIEDGCADKTQEVHDVVVKSILPNRCHVVKAEEWIAEWEKTQKT